MNESRTNNLFFNNHWHNDEIKSIVIYYRYFQNMLVYFDCYHRHECLYPDFYTSTSVIILIFATQKYWYSVVEKTVCKAIPYLYMMAVLTGSTQAVVTQIWIF